MVVVRFIALAALVVWLHAELVSVGGAWLDRPDLVAYVCGAVVLVCLFVMKFVGPPPRAFLPRVGIVVLMLGVAAYAGLRARLASAVLVNLALGAVLLGWYVRE